ncbi:MAG: hypothetical protein JNL58_02550 [Planctomyces sp.]|nr:hypothetical protein [Planctomyces sp.]
MSSRTRTQPLASTSSDQRNPDGTQPLAELQKQFVQYAKEKPEVCAIGCLVVGFVLGWKLKPW